MKIQHIVILGITGMLLCYSCSDTWKDHYEEENFNLPENTIYGSLKGTPELSVFTKMVEKAGYKNALNGSLSYTVWAPTNEALATVDTTNADLVLKIVTNHIARNRYSTSNIALVPVMNGKFINLTQESDGFVFGGHNILEENINTRNGLVHKLNGYVPYLSNLWEYISQANGLDSLNAYLYSQSDSIFDPLNSVEIGVNSQGQTIYADSAFIHVNNVLQKIGIISAEDSSFTLLMPDNTAWNEAYGRTEKYFNFSEADGDDARKQQLAKYTIVKDMAYRARINDATSLDSLVSSTGTVFYNPGSLFANYTSKEVLSNGIGYIVNKMPFNDTIAWFKKIKVEAEDTAGRSKSNNLFERTSYGSGFNVSQNKYLLVDPTTAGSKVEFSIPNTLSAKYKIYCVFVPYSIVNPGRQIATKANFTLTYIKRKTGGTFSSQLNVPNNITSAGEITKMFVTEFDFEFANVIDDDFSNVKVKLEVSNAVTSEEEKEGRFTREMRIDYIILEPVFE